MMECLYEAEVLNIVGGIAGVVVAAVAIVIFSFAVWLGIKGKKASDTTAAFLLMMASFLVAGIASVLANPAYQIFISCLA